MLQTINRCLHQVQQFKCEYHPEKNEIKHPKFIFITSRISINQTSGHLGQDDMQNESPHTQRFGMSGGCTVSHHTASHRAENPKEGARALRVISSWKEIGKRREEKFRT